MTFPALDAFALEPRVGKTTYRVYRLLQLELLDFQEPRAVKVRGLAARLHMQNSTIISALTWLVDRGYLVEHARSANRVRVFTLAWTAKPRATLSVSGIAPL